jgi:hypothetical protein
VGDDTTPPVQKKNYGEPLAKLAFSSLDLEIRFLKKIA